MLDLTANLLPALKATRIEGLNLGDDFQLPDYAGGSILNIASTLSALYGIPSLSAPPLRPDILEPLQSIVPGGVRQVILVLVDALALHRLQRWLSAGRVPAWQRVGQNGLLAPLTSIFPSTTSSCLPSIWSGLSPAQHGMAGYESFLKEYGMVTNLITHSPFAIPGHTGLLEEAGFEPETLLPGPTLGEHLAASGIKAHAYQHYTIARSGMSRIFMKGVDVHPFGSAVELWANVRQMALSKPGERRFIGVYWSNVDTFAHVYGPDDERCEAEFWHFSQAFEDMFLNKLPAGGLNDTLVMLMADHGQVFTPKDPHYDLNNHPQLLRRLHLNPTGENRAAYFYIRPGQTEAVREYLARTFLNQFAQLDPLYALEQGLFGPGTPHPRLAERIGDLLALAKGSAYFWWGSKPNPLFGRHGGLHPEEMLVPFLAGRV